MRSGDGRAVADLKQVLAIDSENKRAKIELKKLSKFEESTAESPLTFDKKEFSDAQ